MLWESGEGGSTLPSRWVRLRIREELLLVDVAEFLLRTQPILHLMARHSRAEALTPYRFGPCPYALLGDSRRRGSQLRPKGVAERPAATSPFRQLAVAAPLRFLDDQPRVCIEEAPQGGALHLLADPPETVLSPTRSFPDVAQEVQDRFPVPRDLPMSEIDEDNALFPGRALSARIPIASKSSHVILMR